MFPPKIRVLIIDDSAVVRRLAAEALNADPALEVIGTATDPYAARDLMAKLQPDVITLDIEMPRMNGLTFLEILMQRRPTPVIVMSSLSQQGSEHALEALRLGAFDVIAKPHGSFSFGELGAELVAKVKAASGIPLRALPPPAKAPPARAAAVPPARLAPFDPRAIILLGASTGGTEALKEVITRLPPNLPGIAIVQHIPPVFSRTFADRLGQTSALDVREAVDGDKLAPGVALIAPGNFHLLLHWAGAGYRVRVTDGPQVWHQRPAVDVLFKSAADCGAGPHALAGVLTGMGKDGAEGLLRLREKGATTFAQDEATSVVYGMPRVAWENSAAQRQLPLPQIAAHLTRHFAAATAAPFATATRP
ncbi:MAG: chemotaxis response regulator protein-glutamate methylesterase [Opitutae bacterium]|nr:chemotaxis response regulator protein-glutamate methylesterase [Opitutae bacterium]